MLFNNIYKAAQYDSQESTKICTAAVFGKFGMSQLFNQLSMAEELQHF